MRILISSVPHRHCAHYRLHSHSHGTSTGYAYDGYGSRWSTIREEDKRQRVRRLVWEMVIKLGTKFTEEVVTGFVYLGITGVDSVEYSGLMIDGERISFGTHNETLPVLVL